MLQAYSVFDDFPQESIDALVANDVSITLLPKGMKRPQGAELKAIIEEYDIVFISTAQTISEEMFERVDSIRIVGTVSRGIDHIHVPSKKKDLIHIVNAESNSSSVAEHVFSLVFAFYKRLLEGRALAAKGKHKKEMSFKPQDISDRTIGVIGAGSTASEVIRLANAFRMNCLCWTRFPERHRDLMDKGVVFSSLDSLLSQSDIISVHLPLLEDTRCLIDSNKIRLIKKDAVFINTSRPGIVDNNALFDMARQYPSFSVGMDCDAESISGMWDESMNNVIVTPHIAGGTVQARKRLFNDCTNGVIRTINKQLYLK